MARNKYKEHWRHIQYETDEAMAKLFFAGHEYSQYLECGGLPFKEDIFYQSKCRCIEQSKFEECSCPTCTLARETVRDWDRQRKLWYKEATDECPCGSCAVDSDYRCASRSFASLRAFLHAPCGKQRLAELIIAKGPKSCEKVEMYRRQCCRALLPEISNALKERAAADEAADAAASLRAKATEMAAADEAAAAAASLRAKATAAAEELAADVAATATAAKAAAAAEKAVAVATAKATAAATKAGYTPEEIRKLEDCKDCGLEACMPHCPIERDDSKPATWKEWRPRIEADGKSYQSELREIKGTRKGLMERIEKAYTDGDPHEWANDWTTQARHLIYATGAEDELFISTDFSAQFDHKCAWTLTCEHPPRSNQAVYVVTFAYVDASGERIFTTHIWRIFSEVKGDALFHNTALSQIVEYYKERLSIRQVHVFTDGCRGQYKGKRTFQRIASFPSEHLISRQTSTAAPPSPDAPAAPAAAEPAAASAHGRKRSSSDEPEAEAGEARRTRRSTSTTSTAAGSAGPAAPTAPAVEPAAASARGRKRKAPDEPEDPQDSVITEHEGVRILHHFAVSHHFKGPHDAYGKDPKFLGRMAERHQRVRLATTFDLYNFCAETMPAPKRLTAKQIVAPMPIKPAAELTRLPPERLPEHLRRQQTVGVPTWGQVLEAEDDPVASEDICPSCEPEEEVSEPAEVEPEPEEDLEPDEAEVERPEEASDSEAEEDGAGDLEFEFDETGARIRPEEEAAQEAAELAEAETRAAREAAALAEAETHPSALKMTVQKLRQRRSRQVGILQQAAGQEHTSEGETRLVQQGPRAPGIFSASKYFWMYYAPYPSGLEIVKPGERAGPGQCHAELDAAANVDADSVTGSNSTYCFAGIDANQPDLLYTKTFTCAASCCRDRSTISLDSRGCPFEAFTGRWRQQTCASIHGVVRVAAEKRLKASEFAKCMHVEHVYAVFGGYKELGDRPYWLLWCVKLPYQAPKAPNNLTRPRTVPLSVAAHGSLTLTSLPRPRQTSSGAVTNSSAPRPPKKRSLCM